MCATETDIQSLIRVEASRLGAPLWRNNNGAAQDKTGRVVRYGLGNDSSKLNEVWKSSDLIGITPVLIRPEHVGQVWGIFTAVEVKAAGWSKPRNDRDRAQERFIKTVQEHGGIGFFADSIETYLNGGVKYG